MSRLSMFRRGHEEATVEEMAHNSEVQLQRKIMKASKTFSTNERPTTQIYNALEDALVTGLYQMHCFGVGPLVA